MDHPVSWIPVCKKLISMLWVCPKVLEHHYADCSQQDLGIYIKIFTGAKMCRSAGKWPVYHARRNEWRWVSEGPYLYSRVLYSQTAVCWFIALSGVRCVKVSLYLRSLRRQTAQDSLEEYPGIADAINKYIAAWHWWWRSASERKHTTGRLASACCWVLAFILPQVWLILANPYIPSD